MNICPQCHAMPAVAVCDLSVVTALHKLVAKSRVTIKTFISAVTVARRKVSLLF